MIHLYTIAQERASRLSRLLERRSESSLLLVSRQHQTSLFGEIDWETGDLLHRIFQFLTGGTQIADLFTENLTVSYCMVFKMFRDRDEVGVWNPLKKIDTDTIKIYQLESHRIFVWCNVFLTHKNQILPVFFQPTCSLFQILGLTWWISAAFDRRWLHGKLSTGHCFLLLVRFVLVDFTGSRFIKVQWYAVCWCVQDLFGSFCIILQEMIMVSPPWCSGKFNLQAKLKCKLKTHVMRSMCLPWEVGSFFLQMPSFGPGEVRTYSVHRGKWQRLRRIKCSEWCGPLLTQLHTVKWLRPR